MSDEEQGLSIHFEDATAKLRAKGGPRAMNNDPRRYKCYHKSVLVDAAKAEVECGTCGERLNPMWVLEMLCHEESRLADRLKGYQEERRAWEARRRTKCTHCHKFTELPKASRSEIEAAKKEPA